MTAVLSLFFVTLAAGIPIAFALGLVGLSYLLMTGAHPSTLASQLFGSLNSPSLLAVPFFILAAEILGRSGATDRLIRLFDTLLGHTRGGLPVVAVMSTAFFSAICGSSVATAAAIGVVMIPQMIERGYNKLFAVGLIASAGGLGILIPPSIPLVIYGMVTEQSIAKLFLAGMIVGIGLTICLLILTWIIAARSDVVPKPKASWQERKEAFTKAWGVLLAPVIVLGGIYGGIFTPTEAAAISCVYAMALALAYRVSLLDLLPMLTHSASVASIIMIILAGAQLFGYVLTAERIPHLTFDAISSLGLSKNEFLLGTMLFFLLAGMFLEVLSIILITMPILMPLINGFQIDPVHFGIMLILNMELAVITPPIGLNLFVISATSGVPVLKVFQGTLPFVLLFLVFLAFVIFAPGMDYFFRLL